MRYRFSVGVVTALIMVPIGSFAAQPLQLQIDQIKTQQQQLQQQIAQLQGSASSGGLVHVGEIGGGLISAQSSRFGRDLGILKLLQKSAGQVPLLTLGGVIETNVSYGRGVSSNSDSKILSTNGYSGQNSSAVWLDTARLDVLAHINDWVNGDLQLDLNKSTILRTGVLTVGNLNAAPVYFSIGKMYPYFGDFGGHNTSTNYPLTTNYFRIKAISGASLGFYQSGFNSSLTVFKNQAQLTTDGSTTPVLYSASNSNHLNDWIVNANYSFNINDVKAKVGAGYIADITNNSDSSIARGQIFQKNGEQLPAWNISGQLALGPVSFKANYAQTTKEIARTGGGELKGYNLQAGYKFNWIKPMDVLLGYSALKNTDYLTSPTLSSGTAVTPSDPGLKDQWLLGLRAKLLKNTWGTLEFARVAQYSSLKTGNTSHYNILTADFYVKF